MIPRCYLTARDFFMTSFKLFFLAIIGLMVLSCQSPNSIKSGIKAYEYKKYNKAIGLLKKEYQNTKRSDIRAEKAYYLGKSYSFLNNYQKANEWFQMADQYGYGPKAISGLANTYKNLEKYDRALEQFEKLKTLSPGNQNLQREIFICNQALRWSTEKSDDLFSLRNMFPTSRYAEYSPSIYENEWIVFTSDNEESTGSKRYDWTGNRKSDLFIMNKKGGAIRKFDGLLNTKNNEGTTAFNKTYDQVFFTRCFDTNGRDEYCKLMVSNRIQGVWSEPQVLPFVSEEKNYGQPALIENDSVLVFSCKSQDQGYDLWYSFKDNNLWTPPLQMPSYINTPGNEHFPTSDGDTLYYSSDHLPGLGGLDIFKTFLRSDGSWEKPINVKPPYNSGGDDFGLTIDRSKNTNKSLEYSGYFTSNRSNTGNDDIFYFEKYKSTSTNTPEIKKEKPVSDFTIYLAGKVFEHLFEIPDDPNSPIASKAPIPKPHIEIKQSSEESAKLKGNQRGLFITSVEQNETYIITAKKQGYLNASITLNTNDLNISSDDKSHTINVELFMDKIYKGKEIILDNIYYDFDDTAIRKDAQPTLDILASKLMLNPHINIELSSHTDCRGEIDYNNELSQKRAQSAVKYLIQKGVNPDQLTAKGYGESSPIINCDCDQCSEDDHQQNRRTSFKIL